MKIKKTWLACGYALTATCALSSAAQAGSGALSSAADDGTNDFSPPTLRQAGLR